MKQPKAYPYRGVICEERMLHLLTSALPISSPYSLTFRMYQCFSELSGSASHCFCYCKDGGN